MNKADFTATDQYPITTQGMDFLQSQIHLLQNIVAMLGQGYWILNYGTATTPGTAAIVDAQGNSEIFEFDYGLFSGEYDYAKVEETTNASPLRIYRRLAPSSIADLETAWFKDYRIPSKISALTTKDNELSQGIARNTNAISNLSSGVNTLTTNTNFEVITLQQTGAFDLRITKMFNGRFIHMYGCVWLSPNETHYSSVLKNLFPTSSVGALKSDGGLILMGHSSDYDCKGLVFHPQGYFSVSLEAIDGVFWINFSYPR